MISYKKIFHGCIWVLFLSFLVLYFAEAGGYYESVNSKKTYLTNEKIKQFEKDVADGKNVDIKDGREIKVENYMVEIKKDYSNNISKFGLFTSKTFAKYFKKGLTSIFSGIDKMVN